jgi:DNA polymerase III subunit epsilon
MPHGERTGWLALQTSVMLERRSYRSGFNQPGFCGPRSLQIGSWLAVEQGIRPKSEMTLMFIDFEASSLSDKSYPIEIGCAWIEDDRVVHVSDLIRPDVGWEPDWARDSAAVHGIRRDALEQAEPAFGVADRYAALLAGRTVVCDAPEYDGHWLGRLLELLPQSLAPKLVDFDALVHVALSHEGQRAVYAHLAATRSPHRAGPDAARLAAAWLAGKQADPPGALLDSVRRPGPA